MLRLSIYVGSLILMVGWGVPIQAQPDAETLLRAWRASQVERGRALSHVAFIERAVREADSPFGTRRMVVENEVAGNPDRNDWTRTILALRVDGRTPPKARWDAMEERWHDFTRPEFTRLSQAVLLPQRFLNEIKPIGDVAEESLEGLPVWRVDAVPASADSPVEQVTLWFDRDSGALARSRLRLHTRSRRGTTNLDAVIDFIRVEGLDVPRQRALEGTVRTRRRGDVFTILVSLDATYHDYRFVYE